MHLKAKRNCFVSIAKPISNFFTVYQADAPVLPFIGMDLEILSKTIIE